MNNNLLKKYRTIYSSAIIFLAISIIASSCSKNKDDIIMGDEEGIYDPNLKTTQIVLNITGVIGEDVKISGSDNKLAATNGLNSSPLVKTELNNQPGFGLDANTIQAPIGIDKIPALNSTGAKNSLSPIAASSPMTAGKKYRILIYTNNDPKVWKSIQATAGQPVRLDVVKGVTYKWFAYSNNNDEDLTAPTDSINPKVDAPIDKDLLYASGERNIPVTPAGQNYLYPISILFKHKMAQVKVRIDGLHLARYATINGLKASFSRDDYLKSGTFDIKSNTMSNINTVPTTEIFNTGPQPNNLWEAVYYTADPASVSSYKVKITDLPVTFDLVDPALANVNIATFTNSQVPLPNLEKTFNFANPNIGQSLFASIGLSYTLKSRRVLHLSNNTIYGYAMQRGAGWKMMNDLRNFGNLPNSLVRMHPDPSNAGGGVWKDGGINDNVSNNWYGPSPTSSERTQIINRINSTDPNVQVDIVITGANFYYFHPDIQTALVNFVNKGGVLMMQFEREDNSARDLVAKILDMPNTTDIDMIPIPAAGTMYPILNVDDKIVNGPFGDARGKHWGEDSGGATGILYLPMDRITVYSYSQGINRADNANHAAAVSMFRHKTKNFFYFGDGGLTSNEFEGNTFYDICPFIIDSQNRPIPKPYGDAYTPKGYKLRQELAYNGVIAGNLLLWAGQLTEFKGINPWRYTP